ncbi:MAG: molybdopterin molybdotransferase MoeA [Candidatus Methanospirare jalkutatii]|nr:molybdopterin molybdotransferase MoeA [Candidatus Methanospirare jalkutatii]
MRKLISLSEALAILLRTARNFTVGVESVDFDASLGRVLAEDIRSPSDIPPFDRAAMDGFAVRGEDTFGASPENPVVLRKAGTAGGEGEGKGECSEESVSVQAGEYLPIQTGMRMPAGSNAVLMLEYARERSKGELEIFKPVPPGKNVSFKGEDIRKGELLLKSGRILNAYDIGVLASISKTSVKVRKKVKVGIIATGDEIFDPKTQAKAEGKIADSNSFVLSALLSSAAEIAELIRFGIVKDDFGEIKDAVSHALRRCDVLLLTGGSSVGERDFSEAVVKELGGEILFHGVAIRPGEPVGFGIVCEKPVFLLPGFPVATISAFELLVRPFLWEMLGVSYSSDSQTAEQTKRAWLHGRCVVSAVVARKIPSAVGRTDFVRVKLRKTEEGFFAAEPVRVSGSGILSSMTKSDGFVVVEDEKEGIAEGERVLVCLHSF